MAVKKLRGSPQKAKQTKAGQGKVKKVLGEFKTGSLKSSSGKKVTKRPQAIAIALSESRRAGKR